MMEAHLSTNDLVSSVKRMFHPCPFARQRENPPVNPGPDPLIGLSLDGKLPLFSADIIDKIAPFFISKPHYRSFPAVRTHPDSYQSRYAQLCISHHNKTLLHRRRRLPS
jgi:hypothetical protein